MRPRALILRTAGTNCDGETAHAFELAGATPEKVHLNRILENPKQFDDFQLLHSQLREPSGQGVQRH